MTKYKSSTNILRLLSYAPWLTIATFVVTVLSSAAEAMGVGLLLPLLDTSQEQTAFEGIYLLGKLPQLFSGLSLLERVRYVAVGLARDPRGGDWLNRLIVGLDAVIVERFRERTRRVRIPLPRW